MIEWLTVQFATNQIFSGAFLVTVLGSIFYQLKDVPLKILNRAKRKVTFNVTVYEGSKLFNAVELFLESEHKERYHNVEARSVVSRFLNRNNMPDNDYAKNKKERVFLTHLEDFFLVLFNGIPTLIRKERQLFEQADSVTNAYLNSFTFTVPIYYRHKLNDSLEMVLDKYHTEEMKERKSKLLVSTYDWWREIGEFNRKLETVLLPDDKKEFFLSDIENFLHSKEHYENLGVPYKKSYLLHGPPGNGKTSLAKSLASYFKKDIYYVNISNIDERNINNLFAKISSDAVILIEDIDSYYDGRTPIGDNKVSFSSLLNCLDGMFSAEGVITIITTNHIEKLDPALIRSGRCDVKIKIEKPTKDQIEKYLQFVYGEEITFKNFNEDANYNMSDIVNVCLKEKDSDIARHRIESITGA